MDLYDQYRELLEEVIPEIEEQQTSLLDIAGYPNYENVFSNIYAFFLDEKGSHGMKRLFLDALQNALKIEIVFDEYTVQREFATKNGRLDILIEERDEGEGLVRAIGIENKIYHELNNDLDDYRESIRSREEEALVVLTIEAPVHKHDGVEYITHGDWMREIKKLMGEYVIGADPKYLLLLTDFIQHTENLYKKAMDSEGLKFLYTHGGKIQELRELETTGRQQLLDTIASSLSESSNWSWDAKIPSGLRIYGTTKDHLAYLYINDVFSNHEIRLEYWIKRTEKNAKKYTQELITEVFDKFNLGSQR